MGGFSGDRIPCRSSKVSCARFFTVISYIVLVCLCFYIEGGFVRVLFELGLGWVLFMLRENLGEVGVVVEVKSQYEE